MAGMANYTIHPGEDGVGFEISVISDNGARQTMLGFQTVAEADAWIAEDKRGYKRLAAINDETLRPDMLPATEA